MKDQFTNYNGNYEGYTPVNPVPVKAKKNNTAKKIIATAICCSIFGGAVGAGGAYAGLRYFIKDNSSNNTVTKTAQAEDSGKSTQLVSSARNNTVVTETKAKSGTLMTASEVYANNVNSTVGITTSISTTNYFGYKTTAAASGSGFIISDDGYIITNYHVIEGAESIKVTAYDGTTYDAELVGSDDSNDIAVLKVDASGLTPVVLGSSDGLAVGDQVVAIGNPLGELTFSLTSGVVSALDRQVTTSLTTMNLIQTDCAINSGNSGGALFNMYGEVVGITNAKYSSSGSSSEAEIDNIGFAIPIDNVKDIVTSIIENGYAVKPYIGVSVGDVSDEASGYGLPKGASVASVTKDAPADKAGLQANDIITEANGKTITNSADLIAVVKKCAAGDKLELKVYSQGEYKNVTVTVEEKQQNTSSETDNETEEQQSQQQEQQGQQGYGYDPFEEFGGFGSMFGY